LLYNGYYYSSITDSIHTKNKLTVVDYFVRPGKQYKINNIKYDIADTSLAKDFYAGNMQDVIKKGAILSENYLNTSSNKISSYLRTIGYYGFTGNYFFFQADTTNLKDSANIVVSIKNYTRNETIQQARVHKKFVFGDVYYVPMKKNSNPITYSKIGDSIVVTAAIDTLKNIVDTLNYKDINLIYKKNIILRPKVLQRMNLIKKGAIYNEQDVANTYQKLSNLRLFSSVNFQIDTSANSNEVACTAALVASELQGYKVGLQASTNAIGLLGLSPSVSYYHKNLFKGAELFNVSVMGDFLFSLNSKKKATEFGVSASLSVPNFLFLPDKIFNSSEVPRTEYALSYNFQSRPEYTRNIISGSYSYVWNYKNKFFYKISPLQVAIVKLYNIRNDFYHNLKDPFLINSYQNHFDMGMGANFYFTTDASTMPTKSYFYLRWQNDLSGNLLSLFNKQMKENSYGERLIWGSPYSQYFRTEISAVYTWRFGRSKKQAIATRVLGGVGVGYGNSVTLPFEKLFWAGGAYSLRAWQARTVGPGYAQIDTTFSIPNQTGDIRLEANIEYRFPMFWKFEGAVFLDAGNVWNLKNSTKLSNKPIGSVIDSNNDGLFKSNNFYKHLAADWGLGLRLNLGFALLRLDMGMKIYNPPTFSWMGPDDWLKKGNYGIQFGVGYPF
jgi:Outer membrane protein/protective antigen OMA87